ncbi:MAG TPA: T9SS type A sorting domain-containing protein [Ignavibacteriaceae bacterium]|nr:T9SS type A sorting domain-containing protein [Ignavibacteriaceae bacterium]
MKQLYLAIIFGVLLCSVYVNAQNNINIPSSQDIELKQNFPNPFNPSTQIEYFLPEKTFVEISIYNVLGIKLLTLVYIDQEKGWYKTQFNAEGIPSGLYIYELKTPMFKQTRKMLYMK